MDTPSATTSSKGRWILLAIIGVFVVSALGSFFMGKKMFPENLSPAMKDFRSYVETKEGMEIDGALVRRDGTNARYRAILHIGKRKDDHFFFVEEFSDATQAKERKRELGTNTMVTPARVTQNGVFVLYITNDWNPEDQLAKQLQKVFETWPATPSPQTAL